MPTVYERQKLAEDAELERSALRAEWKRNVRDLKQPAVRLAGFTVQ
jgi:hypothetical protein